jgi:hypothetical protein
MKIASGKLNGDEITFVVGTTTYTGRVQGNMIRGSAGGGAAFTATKK